MNFRSFLAHKYFWLSAAVLAVAGLWAVSPATAVDPINQTVFGVAIKGYDTVAYHTEARAVKGRSEFSHVWREAKWHFASAENRDQFAADPEAYAPQYGGY